MNDHRGSNKGSIHIILIVITLVAVLSILGFLLWKNFLAPKDTMAPGTSTLKPPKIELEKFATGLSKPTVMTSTNQADDERLFVVDQDGKIMIVRGDGSVDKEPFLDISHKILSEGEMGLLGLAFSPEYKSNGYFFVHYVDLNRNTTIARYKVSSNVDRADLQSGEVLMVQSQPYANHKGGDIAFGSDGYLYIALGDGGSGGDPENRAQNLGTLLGKILRIDVNHVPYRVPATNPFVNRNGAKSEIWDYGLRNPWRISFDRQTGELYIADVGQGEFEEINIEAKNKGGNNYGWRCYEANEDFSLDGCADRSSYAFPILQYDHTENRCSITGGYVYRGSDYPAMAGKYFYGDYCGGQLYFATKEGETWTSEVAVQTGYSISTFGENSSGELYLADYSAGTIYSIQDARMGQ
jgi:glucose/arabinose dehydrogenase